jgi:hypothetical protein
MNYHGEIGAFSVNKGFDYAFGTEDDKTKLYEAQYLNKGKGNLDVAMKVKRDNK